MHFVLGRIVENYIGRLKAKLGVRSAAQAAALGTLWYRQKRGDDRAAEAENPILEPFLTPRQRQCLGFLASGCSVRHIALELGLSAKTVEKHVMSLKQKLGARNAAAAVTLGIARLTR
jgi:DNA-binding CsgD family transcriptional regulator